MQSRCVRRSQGHESEPVDVVKTRQQTDDAAASTSLAVTAFAIARDEGWTALFLGWAPTLAGYCYYGLTVYPGYEYFSRLLNRAVAPAAANEFHAAIVLLSGALATLVACVGVCPAEALRIRVVADPKRFGNDGLAAMAARVAAEEGGYGVLYNGLRPLVVRQVIFGMVKFFFFDSLVRGARAGDGFVRTSRGPVRVAARSRRRRAPLGRRRAAILFSRPDHLAPPPDGRPRRDAAPRRPTRSSPRRRRSKRRPRAGWACRRSRASSRAPRRR